MTVRGIDHVGLTVGSLRAALRFYRDLLGLTVIGEGEDSGSELDAITGLTGVRIRYAELELGAGRLLELIEFHPPRESPSGRRPCHPGASHLALRVDDVDGLCERLVTAGVTVPGTPTTITAPGAWCGARCVYAEDPDGHTVELVQRPA